MQVKVKKRKTNVLGTTLFKGTQLEISEKQYNMYQDEFEIIKESKSTKKKNKEFELEE